MHDLLPMSSSKPEPKTCAGTRPGKGPRQTKSTRWLLRDRLVRALLLEIAEGKIEGGQRFPPRRTLESFWGVSKETAARAVDRLKQQGLVAKSNRKTLVVTAKALPLAKRLLSVSRSGEGEYPALVPAGVRSSPQKGSDPQRPQVATPYGNSFLHAQLTKSLLVELASGTYAEDGPFLTRRQVAILWRVSKATTDRAWEELVRSGLLRQGSPRRWLVCPGAMNRASLLLAEKPQPALPSPQTWQSQRGQILHGDTRPEGYRLLAVHDEGNITLERLAQICYHVPHPGREIPGRRHLAFFQQEVARNFCEADYFYDDGSSSTWDALLEHLASVRYHGVAVFRNHLFHSRQPLLQRLRPLGLPIAAVLCHCEGEADLSIDCNDVQGGFTAMQVLLENGHRNIFVLAGDLERPFLQRRLEGAIDCLRRKNLGREAGVEVVPTPDKASCRRRLAQALRRRNPPSALLFLWNKQLRSCDEVFTRFQTSVPREISVMSCGALIFPTRLFGIPDTVHWNSEEIGRLAARQLLGLIHGKPVQHAIQLEMPYIKHGTVAPWKPRQKKRRRTKGQ